jgi:hypothetical protein
LRASPLVFGVFPATVLFELSPGLGSIVRENAKFITLGDNFEHLATRDGCV